MHLNDNINNMYTPHPWGVVLRRFFMSFSILLKSSNISCEHCINTIKSEIDKIDEIEFVSGDADKQSFIVEIIDIESMHLLKKALINGQIKGAALDVFEEEPPQDEEFLSLPNLMVTPHIGGNSKEAINAMGLSAINHLTSFYNNSSK